MKAVGIHEFGSAAELLRYEEVPIPEPGPDELLINIAAASLNRADLALRKGAYRLASDELPVIPGREFAGIVAKLGPGVQELDVGQRLSHAPAGEAMRNTRSRKSRRQCRFRTASIRQPRQRCRRYFSLHGSPR